MVGGGGVTAGFLLPNLIVPHGLVEPATQPLHPGLLFGFGLRDYQWAILLEVARLMRAGYRRILIQLPTGGGKTVMAAAMMGSAALLGLTSEFIVHRKELINQTSKSFTAMGINHGFIASGREMDLSHDVILAGVQTLVRRLAAILPPDLAVLDEAHHATAGTWERVLQEYGDAYVVGLTATPSRLDGRGLSDRFDIMVRGPSPRVLIQRGYLSEYEYFAPSLPDFSEVPVTAGEFNRAAAAAVMDRPKLIGDVVEHYLELAAGFQGIVFAQSREHSRHLAEAFTAEGIPAMHVDGTTPDDMRDNFDEAFRAGDIRIGCNVGLFGEGYDVPNVKYVGIAAGTRSLVNHLQWCGRALRPSGEVAVIADHAGNAVARQLGLPDDERDWTLEGRTKRKSTGVNDDATAVTQCKSCFRVYPVALSHCPGCSEERAGAGRQVRQEAGQLTKLEREALRKAAEARRKEEERECLTFDEFISLGKARGYDRPVGWAAMQCRLRRIPRVHGPRVGIDDEPFRES